jgi:hypothetical protein
VRHVIERADKKTWSGVEDGVDDERERKWWWKEQDVESPDWRERARLQAQLALAVRLRLGSALFSTFEPCLPRCDRVPAGKT